MSVVCSHVRRRVASRFRAQVLARVLALGWTSVVAVVTVCGLPVGGGAARAAPASEQAAQTTAPITAQMTASATTDGLADLRARWTASQGEWPGNPAVQARFALAEALSNDGLYDEALPHWTALGPLVRERNGKGSEGDLIVLARWAECLSALGDDIRAVALSDPGLAMALRRFGTDSLHTDRFRLALATAAIRRDRSGEALPWLEASFDYNLRAGAAGRPVNRQAAGEVGSVLAAAYSRLNRRAEERAMRVRLAELAATEPGEGVGSEVREAALKARSELEQTRGRFAEAAEIERRRLALIQTRLGENDPSTVEARLDLADALSLAEDGGGPPSPEAEVIYRGVIARSPGGGGTEQALAARATYALAERLILTAEPGDVRFAEGAVLMRQALVEARRTGGVADNRVQMRLLVLAYALARAGQAEEARPLLDELAEAERDGLVPFRTRGVAALIRAQLALGERRAGASYGQVAQAAGAFRDYALATGDGAETRRTLNQWSNIFRAQVMMAWRASETPEAAAAD